MTAAQRAAAIWAKAQEQREALRADQAGDLKPPGGGGTFDGMDPWQTSVEKRLESLDLRVGEIRVDLATIKERVSHLPTKGAIDARLVAFLVLIAGLVAFADRIQAFVK